MCKKCTKYYKQGERQVRFVFGDGEKWRLEENE